MDRTSLTFNPREVAQGLLAGRKVGDEGGAFYHTTRLISPIPYHYTTHRERERERERECEREGEGQTDGAAVLTRLEMVACDRPRFPWDLLASSLAPSARAVGDYRRRGGSECSNKTASLPSGVDLL